MMEQFETVLAAAKDFVREVFASDRSGHDADHTFRVHSMAKTIAMAEGADPELVELAALLHDVDDHKLSPQTAAGKDRAVGFLCLQGIAPDRIAAITRIIDQVSFSRNTLPPDSLEGKCVQDADRLDAMGAIGIARAFAYGGSHGRPIHDPSGEHQGSSIAHFYEKLLLLKDRLHTPTARALAQRRHDFMEAFLEEFYREWAGEV